MGTIGYFMLMIRESLTNKALCMSSSSYYCELGIRGKGIRALGRCPGRTASPGSTEACAHHLLVNKEAIVVGLEQQKESSRTWWLGME